MRRPPYPIALSTGLAVIAKNADFVNLESRYVSRSFTVFLNRRKDVVLDDVTAGGRSNVELLPELAVGFVPAFSSVRGDPSFDGFRLIGEVLVDRPKLNFLAFVLEEIGIEFELTVEHSLSVASRAVRTATLLFVVSCTPAFDDGAA